MHARARDSLHTARKCDDGDLTFTIIYRRVIKFPAAAEKHNPGTNKVHIEQAARITASFARNRSNFWHRYPRSYEVTHFPELIAIYKINSNTRDAWRSNKLTE